MVSIFMGKIVQHQISVLCLNANFWTEDRAQKWNKLSPFGIDHTDYFICNILPSWFLFFYCFLLYYSSFRKSLRRIGFYNLLSGELVKRYISLQTQTHIFLKHTFTLNFKQNGISNITSHENYMYVSNEHISSL